MNNNNIGLSVNYVSDWTIEEAIREIIQNNVDIKNEQNVDGYVEHKDGIAHVKDYGSGLEMRHLVMGISEKKDDAIGQFGEGLKLALLVFAREGRNIEIWTKGQKIQPVVQYSDVYETDMVSLNIDELPPQIKATHKGTSIKFECSENELENGKNYFLNYYKRNTDKFEWVVKDTVSLPAGNIWVNGSLVGKLDSAEYSYHFSGKDASNIVNRDRGSVNTEKVESILKKKLGQTRSLKWIETFLELIKNNEKHCFEKNLSFYDSHINYNNKTLWKRGITKIFGNMKLASDNNTVNNQADYKGMDIFDAKSWKWNDLLKNLGMETVMQALSNETSNHNLVAKKDLTKTERQNLEKAVKLIDENYNEVGTIKVATYIEGQKDVVGQYDRSKDVIFIVRKQLDDLFKTMDTILHETVHKHSNAGDRSELFEDAYGKLAAKLILKIGGEM